MPHKIKIPSNHIIETFTSEDLSAEKQVKRGKAVLSVILIIIIAIVIISGGYYYTNAPVNSPPIIDAGKNQNIMINIPVIFNGTGYDNDGLIILYEWDFDGDDIYDWVSTINGTAIHMYQVVGNYTATFRVTDNDNLSSIDYCEITVNHPISELKIFNHRGFIDPQTVYEIVGEVENTGNTNLMDVKITAKFYDSNNNLVGYPNSTTYIDIITPGQKSPFKITRYEAADHYTLESTYVETAMVPYRFFSVINETSGLFTIWGQEVFQINGNIRNDGNLSVVFVEVIVTLYDSSNNVIGGGISAIVSPPSLNPFETSTFTFNMDPSYLAGIIDHYEIQVQCS